MKSAALVFTLSLLLGCGAAPASDTSTQAEQSVPDSGTGATDTDSGSSTVENGSTSTGAESGQVGQTADVADETEEGERADEDTSSQPPESEADSGSAVEETVEEELDESDSCELEFHAEVRDQSGPCTTCRFGDYITVVGKVKNPCAADKNYQSTENCIVSEFIIMNLESGSSSEYPMTCQGGSTVTPVPSGGELTKTRPAGRLSDANYHLTVQFEDPDQTLTELYFTVQ